MSYNTKDDVAQVDLSSTSLSTDMSLLDELFPSLGNGESSSSQFTNQLALLLNTLGSSDDEGTEGTNLLSPLQLSPPRLNEIHALATANLISQTQEAIMQEYNITDLDFEKTFPSETVENKALLSTCTELAFQDDRHACNSHEVHILEHNILEGCELDSNLDRKYNEVNNQIMHSQKDFEHESLVDSNVTLKDMFVDSTCLTKVKLKTSDENMPLTKSKKITTLVSQNEINLEKPENLSAADGETAPNILHTQCSVKSKHALDTFSLHNSKLDYKIGNNFSMDYLNDHSQTSMEDDPPHCVVKHALENLNVASSNYLECDTVDLKKKNNNEVLNYILPPKKRHLECNTLAVTFSDIKTQFEHDDSDVDRDDFNNLGTLEVERKELNSTAKSNKNKERGQPMERSILFVCVICLKQFNSVDDLELHSTNHLQYSCLYPGCVRTFAYRSHLSYHRQTHEGEKKYQCSECGKVFAKAQHLDVHSMTHRQSKPFSCSVCSKGFTTVGNLKNHSRTHSGERPYVCDIKGCTKSFAERSSLKKHKITHTGEKSYRCDICGKCFTQASSRSYHMKKHKEIL